MLKTKPLNNDFHFSGQSIGEKLVSVLQQPLFTITFPSQVPVKPPVKQKTVPAVTTVKPVDRKKTVQNRPHPIPVSIPRYPTATRNTTPTHTAYTEIFTPARNKEEFEKILFVLRASDKHGSAPFTKALHVEQTRTGSRLIASDGKRLHVASIKTRIRPGDYNPAVTKDAVRLGKPVRDVHFPNWERVVPTDTVLRGCVNIVNAVINEKSPEYVSFVRQAGERVNPQYLADLTKKPWALYRQKVKRKALLLKEHGAKTETYAVIMPLAA
jgi:hypothetical protein